MSTSSPPGPPKARASPGCTPIQVGGGGSDGGEESLEEADEPHPASRTARSATRSFTSASWRVGSLRSGGLPADRRSSRQLTDESPGQSWSSRMNLPSSSPRRLVALLGATALAVSGLAVSASTLTDHSRPGDYAAIADLVQHCDEVIHSEVPRVPHSCAHSDEAPPGVDVDKYVPTAALEA